MLLESLQQVIGGDQMGSCLGDIWDNHLAHFHRRLHPQPGQLIHALPQLVLGNGFVTPDR